MRISETPFSFLEGDCIAEFGEKAGSDIYRRTDDLYFEIEKNSDYMGSDAICSHIQMKLLPPLAYYKTLAAFGYEPDKALSLVRKETKKTAEKKRDEMAKMARLPFSYMIYRLFVKSFMAKNFPEEGWQTEWVKCDGKEIHFNLHRCIYHDLCAEYGCPELCTVYCENDDISFSGLLPKIQFERNGTLASGAGYCDFHFKKGKA